MPQLQLPIFPEGSTEINLHLAMRREGNEVAYFYGCLPVYKHHVDDNKSFRVIISQLIDSGGAKQSEICKAFGIPSITVKRAVKLYREKGIKGFFEPRKTRGGTKLTPSILEKAQQFLNEGHEVVEVAHELNIKKDTIRKAVESGRLHKISKKKI